MDVQIYKLEPGPIWSFIAERSRDIRINSSVAVARGSISSVLILLIEYQYSPGAFPQDANSTPGIHGASSDTIWFRNFQLRPNQSSKRDYKKWHM